MTPLSPTQPIRFRCNICGGENSIAAGTFHRELAHCHACGSCARFRGIVHALSLALYGESLVLAQFPKGRFRGIGMSDWDGYAHPLAEKFAYHNTFYHCEPRLDLVTPASVKRWAGQDFVISTDVLEHIPPPAQQGFDALYQLLAPGGVLVFSVPFTDRATVEHFPDLHDYQVMPFKDDYVLVNRTREGNLWVRDQLVFHGGPGSTLEMRVFGRDDLLDHLRQAGFVDIIEMAEAIPGIGYYWPPCYRKDGSQDLGYIVTARRPR